MIGVVLTDLIFMESSVFFPFTKHLSSEYWTDLIGKIDLYTYSGRHWYLVWFWSYDSYTRGVLGISIGQIRSLQVS